MRLKTIFALAFLVLTSAGLSAWASSQWTNSRAARTGVVLRNRSRVCCFPTSPCCESSAKSRTAKPSLAKASAVCCRSPCLPGTVLRIAELLRPGRSSERPGLFFALFSADVFTKESLSRPKTMTETLVTAARTRTKIRRSPEPHAARAMLVPSDSTDSPLPGAGERLAFQPADGLTSRRDLLLRKMVRVGSWIRKTPAWYGTAGNVTDCDAEAFLEQEVSRPNREVLVADQDRDYRCSPPSTYEPGACWPPSVCSIFRLPGQSIVDRIVAIRATSECRASGADRVEGTAAERGRRR